MAKYLKKGSRVHAVYFAGDVGDPEVMWLDLPSRRVVNGRDRDVLILTKDGKDVWVEPGQMVCWKDDSPETRWVMDEDEFFAEYEPEKGSR